MKAYRSEQIRNVGLFSHGGAGKTTLSETMLFNSGAIGRLGRVEDGIMTVRFTWRNGKVRIFGPGYWRKGKAIYEEANG